MAFAFFKKSYWKKMQKCLSFVSETLTSYMYLCAEHECRVLSCTLFLTQQYHLSNRLLNHSKQVCKTLAIRCIFT